MSKRLIIVVIVWGILGLTACMHNYTSKHPYTADQSEQEAKGYAYGASAQVAQQLASNAELRKQRIIYFAFDKSTIAENDLAVINAHAQYLKSHPKIQVRLEGHTDERGSSEYNIGLGERRDKAVASLLRVHGVRAEQIQLVSYGKEKPAVLGHTEAAYSQNRRVELHYEHN